MKKIAIYLLLAVAVFSSQLNAVDICALRPGTDFLPFTFNGPKYICNKDIDASDLLDFNDLTEVNTIGGGVTIYEDKSGNTWFVKQRDVFREYIGGHILRLILGGDRIAEIKLIKGYPSLVASKKLEDFYVLDTLGLNEGVRNVDAGFKFLDNNEDLLVGMTSIGLSDWHIGNQGYIKKNGKLEAARVDYDYSFLAEGFGNRVLFKEYIDYGKLERAIIDLLKLPDDQIHQIFEKAGIYLELPKQKISCTIFIDHKNCVFNYLKVRKDNFKQLLPLITCLKKVLNEGDINYLNENKSLLASFQNTIGPELELSHLNILIRQFVQKGCVEALRKLKELELYEDSKKQRDLISVAYEAKQSEVLKYLLEGDKTYLPDDGFADGLNLKTLEALRNGNYEVAKKLIEKSLICLKWNDPTARIFLERILKEAIYSNDLSLVKAVIVRLDVDIEKAPVLELALEGESSLEIFQYLLREGARAWLSIKPDLIHEAARKQRADVFKLFLEYGANPDLQDEYGKTAHSYFRVRVLD